MPGREAKWKVADVFRARLRARSPYLCLEVATFWQQLFGYKKVRAPGLSLAPPKHQSNATNSPYLRRAFD